MSIGLDGNAIVYCEGEFRTTDGKTAHGLVRRSGRYRVLAVIDSATAGRDSGAFLDGRANGIPLVAGLEEALDTARSSGLAATHLVIGMAPPGGTLNQHGRATVAAAIRHGLHIDSGLHDFLNDDPELAQLADRHAVRLRDVRKPPDRKDLHFFSGKIQQVPAFRIAILGTDSAVGKRTTAWALVDALKMQGYRSELVGTGQTAWMQGARFSIALDSLVNDFVAGEIEHAVWRAWKEAAAEVVVIEGQGSLMHPAYPGGFEILAAARPHVIVLQHAPARREYDGFPGYPLHSLETQIQALTLVSGKPVVAVTVNHEDLIPDRIPEILAQITQSVGIPAFDVLHGTIQPVTELLGRYGLRPAGTAVAQTESRKP